jgi:hypothetical protein
MTIDVIGLNPVLVTAVSDTTTDLGTTAVSPSSGDDRTYVFAANIGATVADEVTVNGNGLSFQAAAAGAIAVNNEGRVVISDALLGGGLDVVAIQGNGGAVTYGGPGDILHLVAGATGAGLGITNTGAGDITVSGTGARVRRRQWRHCRPSREWQHQHHARCGG